MRKILNEPLLHFLLIGAVLFFVFDLVSDQNTDIDDEKILVSAGRIVQLSNIFGKTWQRPPTREELQGLIDDFVLEEIYYRQAVAMGIDRDDTIIRRRLRQKFEFLTDDVSASIQPTDEELSEYLAAHPETFRRDSTYTFRQVYINPEKFGDDLEGHVAEQLAALKAGKISAADGGLLPASLDRASGRAVDGTFGSGFAAGLDKLPSNQWQGPIESGLGIHLVHIDSRTAGTVPELAAVRPMVEREWAYQKRLESRSMMNEALLQQYEVEIDWPTAATKDPGEAR